MFTKVQVGIKNLLTTQVNTKNIFFLPNSHAETPLPTLIYQNPCFVRDQLRNYEQTDRDAQTKPHGALQLHVRLNIHRRWTAEIPSLSHVHRNKTLSHKSELVGPIHQRDDQEH